VSEMLENGTEMRNVFRLQCSSETNTLLSIWQSRVVGWIRG
jgi:hypothetical protein